MATDPIVRPSGVHHVRLTVTDIHRSKAFYQQLLGDETAFDFSDQANEPGVLEDQSKLFGGTGFMVGNQLLGLRPIGSSSDTFSPVRVGLDHIGLLVESRDDLTAAARRLDDAGVEHGEITELPEVGMVILSVQDPDDINLELVYMPAD